MHLDLPPRPSKPRTRGITAITDVGIPLGELPFILESYHDFVDMAKLGIGTAYMEPRLTEKLACYRQFGIPVYFGGTLFEKFYFQKKLEAYLDFLRTHQISHIEISCGTIPLPPEKTQALIKKLKQEFKILVEVGKKEKDPSFTPKRWIQETCDALDAGCDYVVLEGRNTADAGIYNSQGTLDTSLIHTLTAAVDKDRLIFEAPTPQSQALFINLLGPNVNMGNVFARDLLLVETQRAGLREETFFTS